MLTREDFLEKMVDVLQTEEEISFDTVLEDLEDWDSLSKMAVIAFLNKEMGKNVLLAELKELVTISDIAKKAGIL